MFRNNFANASDGAVILYLNKGRVCLLDRSDLLLVLQHNWHAYQNRNNWYARTAHNGGQIYMHRLIMSINDPDLVVHHKDGDGLNNRRENLEVLPLGDHISLHKAIYVC